MRFGCAAIRKPGSLGECHAHHTETHTQTNNERDRHGNKRDMGKGNLGEHEEYREEVCRAMTVTLLPVRRLCCQIICALWMNYTLGHCSEGTCGTDYPGP